MTKTHTALPPALNTYLMTSSKEPTVDLAGYTERGAELVDADAILALRDRLGAVREKINSLQEADRLKSRLEILALYFEETLGGGAASANVRREVAFALLYFLKGYDRIPDSIPEIGLLDDALIVDTVIQRNVVALSVHWARRGRTWKM